MRHSLLLLFTNSLAFWCTKNTFSISFIIEELNVPEINQVYWHFKLILSYIFNEYPIIVYDNFNDIKYLFNNGPIEVNKNNINNFSNKEDTIKIQFDFESNNDIPTKIFSIYTKITDTSNWFNFVESFKIKI